MAWSRKVNAFAVAVGAAIALAGLPLSQAGASAQSYDQVVLADHPVGYWPVDGTGSDLSGNGHSGTYVHGTPGLVTLPDGEPAADFDGSSQYLTVPSSSQFSIPATGQLTWEGWIRPDTLTFPHASSSNYVDWMGKCANYAPSCEWEARMYDDTNTSRTQRLSAYAFNPAAGLGSGAYWQPASAQFTPGGWIYVVGEYQTQSTPSRCDGTYPGSIDIWVDGVPWSSSAHGTTGCMSQYSVTPQAGSSPLNIGSMALDTYFPGAVGKVAVYDAILSPAQIAAHYQAMTGQTPSGSCASTCTVANQPGGSPIVSPATGNSTLASASAGSTPTTSGAAGPGGPLDSEAPPALGPVPASQSPHPTASNRPSAPSVTANMPRTVTLDGPSSARLDQKIRLTGRVTASNSKRVPRARVDVYRVLDGRVLCVGAVTTTASGTFTLTFPAEGTASYYAVSGSVRSRSITNTVRLR